MKLHHVGFIVDDIDKNIHFFKHKKIVNRIIDKTQNAELVCLDAGTDTYIELIQPLNENAFTWNHLIKNGTSFHHFCYQVEDLEETDLFMRNNKILKVLGPIDAPLFDMKVVFGAQRNKTIIEFIF